MVGTEFDAINNGGLSLDSKLDEIRKLLGKSDDDPLRIVSVGAGAWGSVFAAMLQDGYGHLREKVQIRIWRRPGRPVDKTTAHHLFDVINSREDVLRRLIRRCAYLKYVEARLGDRILYADEILKDGFCVNMIDTPLCPLKVVTNLQEAVWDADIVINGLPSTETRQVFDEISKYWKERISVPVIISLTKGIEAELEPEPHIITPTQMISRSSKLFLVSCFLVFNFSNLVSIHVHVLCGCLDDLCDIPMFFLALHNWLSFVVNGYRNSRISSYGAPLWYDHGVPPYGHSGILQWKELIIRCRGVHGSVRFGFWL